MEATTEVSLGPVVSHKYNAHLQTYTLSLYRRMMTTFPGTKTYFAHLDIRPRSTHLRSHGKKIVLAIAECSKDISSMMVTLAPLQTLHAYKLRIDPCNFKVPSLFLLMNCSIRY